MAWTALAGELPAPLAKGGAAVSLMAILLAGNGTLPNPPVGDGGSPPEGLTPVRSGSWLPHQATAPPAHPAIEPAKATRPARVGPLPHGGGRFLQLVRKGRCGPSGGADGSCFLAPNVPLVRAHATPARGRGCSWPIHARHKPAPGQSCPSAGHGLPR